MRTTVELSDPIYKRLKSEAVERGIRGFSPIVEEALAEHFQWDAERRRWIEAVAAAEGAWRGMDVEQWERDVKDAWATWQLPRS
jgi:hypothetical protein